MLTFEHNGLRRSTAAVFAAAGVEEDIAQAVANLLVDANLAGHDSHGIQMAVYYIDCIKTGGLDPKQRGRVVSDCGSVLVVDGGIGFGAVIGAFAMDEGMARVASSGAQVVAVRNSHHLGRIGTWAERCLDKGLISIHFVNAHGHPPLVAPYGGIEARLGTNPICAAMPATDRHPPFVLDLATSRIAFGKVGVAFDKNEVLAEGMMIDRQGRPTTDPATMIPDATGGALVPLGDHKGFGLGLLCDLLGGALTGGGTSHPGHHTQETTVNGMLSILIDPKVLGGWQTMTDEIDALYDWARSASPAPETEGVLLAGEPERRNRAERVANGIPIAEAAWEDLVAAAAGVGIDRDALDRLAGQAI
ncbi:MAG: malate/lactate/ureidoglycolate dehydrogenase [Pseudomonadota bacterium]